MGQSTSSLYSPFTLDFLLSFFNWSHYFSNIRTCNMHTVFCHFYLLLLDFKMLSAVTPDFIKKLLQILCFTETLFIEDSSGKVYWSNSFMYCMRMNMVYLFQCSFHWAGLCLKDCRQPSDWGRYSHRRKKIKVKSIWFILRWCCFKLACQCRRPKRWVF